MIFQRSRLPILKYRDKRLDRPETLAQKKTGIPNVYMADIPLCQNMHKHHATDTIPVYYCVGMIKSFLSPVSIFFFCFVEVLIIRYLSHIYVMLGSTS